MFCPKCGKEIADTANVCGYCGFKMPAKAEPPPAVVEAAAPLAEEPVVRKEKARQEVQTDRSRPTDRGKKMPGWVWGVIGGVIVVTVVVAILLRGGLGGGKNTDSIAGDWIGVVSSPDGSFSATLEVHIDRGCKIGDTCGTYRTQEYPSFGTLQLVRIDGSEFIFLEQNEFGQELIDGSGYQSIERVNSESVAWYFEQSLSSGEKITSAGMLFRE